MELPKMAVSRHIYSKQITEFPGFNRTENHAEGAIADGYGISSDGYPTLQTARGDRVIEAVPNTVSNIFSWDGKMLKVDGTKLYYDGTLIGNCTAGTKQFAVVNTKLCMMPDKKYIDLTDNTVHTMEAVHTIQEKGCYLNQSAIKQYASTRAAVITQAVEGYHYVDATEGMLQETYFYCRAYKQPRWNAKQNEWQLTPVDNTPERMAAGANGTILGTGVWVPLVRDGDSYKIDLQEVEVFRSSKKDTIVKKVVHDYAGPIDRYFGYVTADAFDTDNTILTHTYTVYVMDMAQANKSFASSFTAGDRVSVYYTNASGVETAMATDVEVTAVSAFGIEFRGTPFANNIGSNPPAKESTGAVVTRPVIIKRSVPDMDYICSSNNRLWGVSNATNTIYASALGDPANFNVYDGVSTDSYAVAVGSDGEWTGIIGFNGGVLCWKEDKLHKIIGSYPAEYYMTEYTVSGVCKNAHGSMAIINETLYYQGVDAIYAYSGSIPQPISKALGVINRETSTLSKAGYQDMCYYIMLRTTAPNALTGVWVYNTVTGLWTHRSNQVFRSATQHGDRFVYLYDNYDMTGQSIYHMDGSTISGHDQNIDGSAGPITNWNFRTHEFSEIIHGRKGHTRLNIRYDMDPSDDGYINSVFVKYDGGDWKLAGNINHTDIGMTRVFPLQIQRCDRYQIRIVGYGAFTVRSIERQFITGSRIDT